MLRIKKVSDSIFPRSFDTALKSYNRSYKQKLSDIHKEQENRIREHFESQLLKLKEKVETETESEEAFKITVLFKKDPYLFAEQYNIDYQLSNVLIKSITSRVSTHLFKTAEEKNQIKERIHKLELSKITEEFHTILNSIPKIRSYEYKDTPDSIGFKIKYQYNLEKYAEDFNLPFDSEPDIEPTEYMFIYQIMYDKTFNIHLDNIQLTRASKNILMSLNCNNSKIINSQVVMYSPRINDTAFFLYKNCLYQANFDEYFTDEELLLRVKEKVYKDDKRFEQLKKQVELYESDDFSENEKRRREPIPEEVRNEVWRRDQGRCVMCGSRENLEFDHIIPFSKGGSSTARNIQLLCQNCNRHKSDKI